MRTLPLVVATSLLLALPGLVQAKTLKTKYYPACYAGYGDMRELVPTPPVDIEGKSRTIGAVAGLAGRFGGLGALGGAASTAATVAKYSETIADVAAFTKSMQESFPSTRERYLAYGERMGTEAAELQKVADFAVSSQECYAKAYTELVQAGSSGDMKKKEIKKRHQEIKAGVGNVSELLEHAVRYMDTNISAYNQALTQETAGNGLDLGNVMALVTEAQSVSAGVSGLTGGSTGNWRGGLTRSEINLEAHRQAMAAHYAAAGIPNPNPAPRFSSDGLFGGLDSLTTIASIGTIDPGMGAHMALELGVGRANLAAAGQGAVSAESTPVPDASFEALMQAGGDVEPYLDAYQRVKTLSILQREVAGFVSNTPWAE